MNDRERLEHARRALRVIHTWAAYDGGALLDPSDVIKTCRETLELTKPEDSP